MKQQASSSGRGTFRPSVRESYATQVRITWPRPTTFLGRNGRFASHGLEVYVYPNNEIILEPVTSRGVSGRCQIIVPIDALPDLIDTLRKFNTRFNTNNS